MLLQEINLGKIYVIRVECLDQDGSKTAIRTSVTGKEYRVDGRTWGWFSKFEDAEDVVLNNITDIFEYSYNYACIEEVVEGMGLENIVKQWYHAIYDVDKINEGPYPEVVKCDPPKWADGIVNFSMG